jgi:hypothetical protein
MTVIDYLLLWLVAITFAALGDMIWTHKIRPRLAARYGWPDLEPDEIIPTWAWVGAAAVTGLLFIIIPLVGFAAGF